MITKVLRRTCHPRAHFSAPGRWPKHRLPGSESSPAGRFGFLQGNSQHVGSVDQENLRGGSPPVQLRGAHAHRLLYYRSPRGRPYPAPSGKPALPGPGSFRTEGSARCRSNHSAIKPPTRQMTGCGPDACSVEVWMNAGKIIAGKRGIHDGEGLDGVKSAFAVCILE